MNSRQQADEMINYAEDFKQEELRITLAIGPLQRNILGLTCDQVDTAWRIATV